MIGNYWFRTAEMRSVPSVLVMALLMGAVLFSVGVAAGGELAPVTFTAMGCGPYRTKIPGSEWRLARSLKTLNESTDPGSFLIHLGDLFQGNLPATEADYQRVSGMFTGPANRVPTFFAPGDNEWVDQSDAALAWERWRKHFLLFNEKPGQKFPRTVARQQNREEHFAFVEGRVLFIGLNKVGIKTKDKWGKKKKQAPCEKMSRVWVDAAEWIKASYKDHASQFDAVVVLAQAAPFGLRDPIVEALTHVSTSHSGIPLLYLHADDHQYCGVQRTWGYQLMVDQIGGSDNDIVRVTVNPQAKEEEDVFLFRNMRDVMLSPPPSCEREKGFNGGKAPNACWRPTP